MVDTRDLKSLGHCARAGSSPASGTSAELPSAADEPFIPFWGGAICIRSKAHVALEAFTTSNATCAFVVVPPVRLLQPHLLDRLATLAHNGNTFLRSSQTNTRSGIVFNIGPGVNACR